VARAQAVVKPDSGPIFAFRGHFARPSWGWSGDFSVDSRGKVVQLRRAQVAGFFSNIPPCLDGMEACASATTWGRTFERFGHTAVTIFRRVSTSVVVYRLSRS
jgi:hypothetical protein